MINRFGIRGKLLVPIVIGLGIIIFTLIFIWQPNQLYKEKQDFIEAQTRLIKTLTPSIIQNILANDLAELHSIFEHAQLIHKKEWRYIELQDPDQKQNRIDQLSELNDKFVLTEQLHQSGSIDYASRHARNKLETAKQLLDSFSSSPSKDALLSLTERVTSNIISA